MSCRHAWETWPDGQVRCFECDEENPVEKNADREFTRLLLKDARAEAKKAGVAIPAGLHAYMVKAAANPWAEVRDRAGRLLWEGSATDAFEARASAISALVASAGGAQS